MGGGVSRPDGQKTVWTMLILVLNLFYSIKRARSLVLLQRKQYFFQGSRRAQHFPEGVQMLISIKTHISCDFPGGGGGGFGPPIPPLDPHMCMVLTHWIASNEQSNI